MGIEKWVFILTVLLIVDTYHDGAYSKWFLTQKKYFKIASIGFIGLSLYVFIKKYPLSSQKLLLHGSNVIRYLPIDHNTRDMITPIFDLTNSNKIIENLTSTPQQKRMINSGFGTSKRSVSETKKKYVASHQNWMCQYCGEQLDATFEVDHKVDLQYGGSNHVSNLAAVCRKCHAQKGMMNKLQ